MSKKYFGFILTVIFIINIIFNNTIYAKNSKIGDVIGNIYSTDIKAYIDEMEINSYNIGGKTVIIIEDLKDYGFDVIWNEKEKTITANIKAKPQNIKIKADKLKTNKIYHTDIQAYFNGVWCQSYNVGGKTAICLEDIGDVNDINWGYRNPNIENYDEKLGYTKFGVRANWNNEERKITLICLRSGFIYNTDIGDVLISDMYTYNICQLTIMYKAIGINIGGDPIPKDKVAENYVELDTFLEYYGLTYTYTNNTLNIIGDVNITDKEYTYDWDSPVTMLGSTSSFPLVNMKIQRNNKDIDLSSTKTYIGAISHKKFLIDPKIRNLF